MNATQDTSGFGSTTSSEVPRPEPAIPSGGGTPSRLLRRSVTDRMLAGVAAGTANYLGVDAVIVRIAFVVLTLVGGAGVPLYLAAWLLIPEQGASQSVAAELLSSVKSS